MSVVEVVENPKKRKRRRMTAKQRKYFGKRRKTTKRRSRRRNPGLAVLSNPRRRRRSRSYSVTRYRRRRNPGLGGLFGTVDVPAVMFVAGGALGVRILPGMVQKFLPMLPTAGIAGLAVKAGTVLVLGMGTKMITGSKQRATQVVTGGLAILAIELFDMYAAPALGLSGGEYASESEIRDVLGMNGYEATPRGLGRFEASPRGLGAVVDTPDMELAA